MKTIRGIDKTAYPKHPREFVYPADVIIEFKDGDNVYKHVIISNDNVISYDVAGTYIEGSEVYHSLIAAGYKLEVAP